MEHNKEEEIRMEEESVKMEIPARNFKFHLNIGFGEKTYDFDKTFTIGSTAGKYIDMITKSAELAVKRVEEGKEAVLGEVEKVKNTDLGKRTMEVSEKVSSSLEQATKSDLARSLTGLSNGMMHHPVDTTVAVAKVYRDYVKSIVMRPASYVAEKVSTLSDDINKTVKETAERVMAKSESAKVDFKNTRAEYVRRTRGSDGYVRSERQSNFDVSQAAQYADSEQMNKTAGMAAVTGAATVGMAMKSAGKSTEVAGKGVESSGKAAEQSYVHSERHSNYDVSQTAQYVGQRVGEKSRAESIDTELNYHSDIEGPRMSIHNGVQVAMFRFNENMVKGARGESFVEAVPSPNHGDVEKSLSLTMYHNNGEAKQYVNIPGLVGFSKKDDKTYIAIRTTSTPIGDGKYHGGATLNSIEMTLKRFNEGIRSYWNNINRKRNAAKSATVITQENRPVNRDKSKGM